MTLAELLPAVRALTREEKLELARIVNEELIKEDPFWWFVPGAEYHAGYGLYDETSCKAAAIMLEAMKDRKEAK